MAKIIMHIDLNAFFATCETIKNPAYKGKPLVVGGTSRRGIVSTASYEARKYGIHSAMPMYQAKKLCPNLIVCQPDFEFYHDLSNKFFEYLHHYSDLIEVASIDECYVDMTAAMKKVTEPKNYLEKLQKGLFSKYQLPCSIGIAPTKFLAKMASDMKKPLGITILRRRDLPKLLWPLPIKDMYGVGKKTAPKLEKLGIYTIYDIAHTDSQEVKKLLGKFFDVLHDWANGYGSDEVIVEQADPKSIGSSSTFLFDTNDYDEIKALLKKKCLEVSKRAKAENKVGTTLSVTYKDTEFRSFHRSKSFDHPFNGEEEIYINALKIFESNYDQQAIRLIGVTLSNLCDPREFYVQTTLFDVSDHQSKQMVRQLVNELNQKLKIPKIMVASDLKRGGNQWKK